MEVHLIKAKNVRKYARNHASSLKSFEDWVFKIKQADWNKPNDILKTFGTVDFLGQGSNRVVFDVGGNNYRIICTYKFGKSMVHLFVRWIGTHSEYDKLCKKNQQHTVYQF